MLLADMSNMETQIEMPVKMDNTTSPSKAEKQPLVELKNGKVIFRQKPLSCEKMSETMQEIVKFRDFLKERTKEESSPLMNIPVEHVPLIAKLVHESDKTISFLAKHIQGALQPEGMDGDANSGGAAISTVAIEGAILHVCERVNYGIDWMEKASAAASAWRWEVREHLYDMLPKASREKFEARLAERRQAKQDLKALFNTLPQSEKEAYAKTGKKAKADGSHAPAVNDENNPNGASATEVQLDVKPISLSEDALEAKKTVGRPKKDKPVDPERLAKEKEKAEKKAAKEERERKQQEAVNKSRSIMSSFFSKPKTDSSKLSESPSSNSTLKTESSSQSEFEKTFKPYILRKGATLAPINYFEEQRKVKEVIVIDSDAPNETPLRNDEILSQRPDPRELLAEYIRSVSSTRKRPLRRSCVIGSQYKFSSAYCVREIFTRLTEAEVLGDDTAVRRLQALLRSRDKIPAKVLFFHEDYRPGYFGTFTKSSAVVGPRTPLAKDAVAFDYNYDSGEDWEEEDENADDLLSLNGSDAEKSSDVDADEFNGWLVDDDEPIDPGTPLSERAGSPDITLPQDLAPKRKAPADEAKEPKKRKVMSLVPFSKGPCLEVNIGECEYEPFNQYRIQLFNHTPFPIDPFTFVSTPVVIERSNTSKQAFAVPALPSYVQASSSAGSTTVPSAVPPSASDITPHSSAVPGLATPGVAKRAPVQPKNPFPPALLPYFADKVASLNSGNLTWLVESLYQDLRPHRVKKNAIEATVREDCEKCPVRKIWIVKEDVLRSLGRAPPPVPNT